MAIADYDTFLVKKAAPWQKIYFAKNSVGVVQSQATSMWLIAPNNGSAPSTAAVPTKDTAGSLFYPAHQNSSGTQRIVGHSIRSNNRCMFWVVDRLSHQGGLSGTTTTAQTTNLPTSALTRATTGAGVMIGLEIYTVIGTTATTVSCSYTDNVNGAGRTTPLTAFGATGNREVSRLIILPLQAGDSNPVSVESVTVTATTGTAGNFGVTLFKPLYSIYVPADSRCYDERDGIFGGFCNLPQIVDNCCPMLIGFNNTTGNFTGQIYVAED